MNSPTPSSVGSAELTAWEITLKRLLQNSASLPTKEECRQIATQISDPEDGPLIAHAARHLANKMCQSADETSQQAGILLLKELSKSGDPYAILKHAWLCWNEGPLKNHQYALTLIEKAIGHEWPEWPKYERARIALGEAFRLKGLLLFRGDKVKRNPGEALLCFKFAADKYLDGEAAWLAAQFHTRSAASDFANNAKPHAKAHEWYMDRAKKQGFAPAQSPSTKEVQS
jgi:hypothetical protein